MKEELVAEVMKQMLSYLDNAQLKQLRQVMEHTLFRYGIFSNTAKPEEELIILSFIFINISLDIFIYHERKYSRSCTAG